MATNRKATRQRIHQRIRKKVSGTAERPRLAVHFSGKHVYAQVIDDDAGKTLAAASTYRKIWRAKKAAANRASAQNVSARRSRRSCWRRRSTTWFSIAADYIYHGKVKALADAAREGGLKF